jgi:hypothetical protein
MGYPVLAKRAVVIRTTQCNHCRVKAVAAYAAAWSAIIPKCKRFYVFHILCTTLLYVNSHISQSAVSHMEAPFVKKGIVVKFILRTSHWHIGGMEV